MLRDIYDRLFVLILGAQRSPPSASLYFLNIYRGWIPDTPSISGVPLTIVWLLLTFDDAITTITSKNLVLFVNCIGYADITCNHRQILDYRIIAIFINFSRINWLESKLYVFIILLWYTLVVLCYRYWLQSDISSSNHWYIYITSVSVSNDITVSISCNRWNVYRI